MISNCIIFCTYLSSYNSLQIERCGNMKGEPLKIKRRGEDGNKVITVRIREDTLDALDKIAAETNRSRNELINIILSHGVRCQTGDKTKYNTIIINNSTHDTGIQLTGCIVFQQKARGSIFASLCLCFAVLTVFVRFHRDFVSVGKSAEKTSIEKSK